MRVRICIAKSAMDRQSFPRARYGGVGLGQGDVGEVSRKQQWQGERTKTREVWSCSRSGHMLDLKCDSRRRWGT